MSSPQEEHWSTSKEIEFLKHIGTYYIGHFRDLREPDKPRELRMLTNYLESMLLREVWDGLDRKLIVDYVVTRINGLKAQGVVEWEGP